jgi:hypothetical protein
MPTQSPKPESRGPAPAKSQQPTIEEWTHEPRYGRFWMRVLFSVLLMVAGLYVLLFGQYPPDTQKWAYGAIGTAVGMWVPGK